MEESKSFTVKQTQAGDDSGYSCTSTQSKYSQSTSSGYSFYEERKSNILKTTEDRKISIINSKSPEELNQTILRDVSDLETTTNTESNKDSSISEQINLTKFEPQMDKIFNKNEPKQLHSTSNIVVNEFNNLNEDIKEDQDTVFFQSMSLCKSYRDHLSTKNLTSDPSNKSTTTDTVIKELNDQEVQLKEIIESNEIHEDSFDFVVSMYDGLIINTSNSIQKSMGYPKYMWQGRSFIDFIHPKDHISFISYVTSVLTDPCTISRQDDLSSVTFLKAKNNDGFHCNMRRYSGLNAGYSIDKKINHYQVCKLTITFKDLSNTSTTSCLVKTSQIPRSQLLLIVKAQLIYSAYTSPEEKNENPISFITKHNAMFEWCYVDPSIISYFGYLPQNIIGKSIFDYFNLEDLTTIREIHENMAKSRSVPYKGNPYRFKCQNGDFALVQTEWSNFVNPWSGRVEFVIGKHKVLQGPINPDVTTPIDNVLDEAILEDKKNLNEIYEDIKNILNKNTCETTEVSHQINQTFGLISITKQHKSKKCKNLASYMNNCYGESTDSSMEAPIEVKVQPETCRSLSNHDSVILGDVSSHHNCESKSSSGTPPSYTQLNYNDNILRYFKSNIHTNLSEEEQNDQNYPKEVIAEKVTTPFDTDMEKVQQDTDSWLQSVTPSSSKSINLMSTSYCSEQNSSRNSQQQLTQKMLLRHNKKMEDDLVNQHKNNAKRITSNKTQKQNLPDETNSIPKITHGIKRSSSSQYENMSCKLNKIKRLTNCSTNDGNIQTQENEDTVITPTIAKATQIWPPCKITRDSQTMVDLPRPTPTLVLPNSVLCYRIPLSNNVMSVKQNEYESPFTLMDPCGKIQESPSNQLQLLTLPLYTTIPVMNHISQNSQILQPCLHHNQLLLQQPNQNIQCENKMDPPNEAPVSIILSKKFDQKTKNSQVNQEEVITSSDSECKSFRSSSGWMYEYSSFYSSSLRDKTDDSSNIEECSSLLPNINKTIFLHEPFKKSYRVEDVFTTPEIIFRYQIEHRDIKEVLRKDMNILHTLTQPSLVNEQLKQFCVELDEYGVSKTSYFEDGSSSSGDECLISIGNNKKGRIDFSRMAMIYEENAPLPSPTISPRET